VTDELESNANAGQSAGSDNTEPDSNATPETGGGAGTTEDQAPETGDGASTGGDSGAGAGNSGGTVSNGQHSTSERASTGTASSPGGQDTGSAGYPARRGNSDTGGGPDLGPDRRAQADKVTPSDGSEEYRSVTTHDENIESVTSEPRFRGPKPFKRWKKRAYLRTRKEAGRK